MLCHKDPNFMSSVTLLTCAGGLLVGALKAICFPGKTCLVPSVSPHRSGAPDPNQSWNPLLKFASVHWCVSCICGWGLWYSGCGLVSTAQSNHPFSLLAIVLLTQPRNPKAFAASARCWLMFSSIHQNYPRACFPAKPRNIVYSFPSTGQGFCSCWISGGSCFFYLNRRARFAFCQFLGACPAPFKGVPCKWAALDAACQVPWMPVGWVLLRYLNQCLWLGILHFFRGSRLTWLTVE